MNKIHIKQFGPVQEADIDIDKKDAGIYRSTGIRKKYCM